MLDKRGMDMKRYPLKIGALLSCKTFYENRKKVSIDARGLFAKILVLMPEDEGENR